MRKIIVKKKAQDREDLKNFIDEAFMTAHKYFGWEFIAEGYVDEDDNYTIAIVEK